MESYKSKQQNVIFIYVPHPFTIDKSFDWGDGNIQKFPKGGWIKVDGLGGGTHGVQGDENNPVGWYYSHHIGSLPAFDKDPIYIDFARPLTVGEVVSIDTLDGLIHYVVKEESYYCYNQDLVGSINRKDMYIQTMANLKENYFID